MGKPEPQRSARRLGRVVVLRPLAGKADRARAAGPGGGSRPLPAPGRSRTVRRRPGVGGQGAEEVVDLLERDAALEAQRGDAVAVQPPGEVAEEGVPRVGRHAGDDQLVPRDADRQHLAGGEEGFEPVDEPLGGFLEMGVAQRVHRALVQHDGELDEKIRQVPRQGRGGARPGSLGEGREPLWDRAHGMWPVIVGPK